MKAILVAVGLLCVLSVSRSQSVDTTSNAKQVRVVFTNAQITAMASALGPTWRSMLWNYIYNYTQGELTSDAAQTTLTQAQQDSIAYYKSRIQAIKSVILQ